MDHITLKEHFDFLIHCTGELPLSNTVFLCYRKRFKEIYSYCIEKQKHAFFSKDADDFCSQNCSGKAENLCKQIRKSARVAAAYFERGTFDWNPTRYPVCDEYEGVLAEFQEHLEERLRPGTVRPEMIIARQFLYHLETSGIEEIAHISTEDVLSFVRKESPNHTGSMPRLLRTVRNLISFLRSKGLLDIDVNRYLMTAGRSRQKALPCFTDKELDSIFMQIDRSTDKGRRDYAIYLLALRTGLRASDISRLKLTDINWHDRTIYIEQQKTGVALYLPLPIDVGNAIAEYILNSRHKTDSPYVFLRMNHSGDATPINPTDFNATLRHYEEAAGIERTGWDGKSFHAFRRTAGTKMVVSGVPAATVAQVLGHTKTESSKCYIMLDMDGLRECCMDLGEMNTRKEGLA